jgi:uncharacterized protein (TIGR03790 family)
VKTFFLKFILLFLTAAAAPWAQTGANVLLVINKQSADSRAIGEYYAKRRSVPATNVCSIDTPPVETIERAVYDKAIEPAVRECLQSHKLNERILYIVTTLGVPLRIDGSGGMLGDQASVDSELTLLYGDMRSGTKHTVIGTASNPFFQAVDKKFEHGRYPIYLVTRLAAYDRAGVFAMIDKSLRAVNRGKFVIDAIERDNTGGNSWLLAAAKLLPADRVVLDTTAKVVTDRTDVIAYASWGSNDAARKTRFLHFSWLPGAIVTEYVSTDGRTFTRPPDSWQLGGSWSDRETHWVRSPQSLAADYLLEGATGASGHVYEPYLIGTPRPDLLLPAYYRGRNLAEAYYAAIPFLSWKNIVIGDPLCRLQ